MAKYPFGTRIRIRELKAQGRTNHEIAEELGIRACGITTFLKTDGGSGRPQLWKQTDRAVHIVRASGHHPRVGSVSWVLPEKAIRFFDVRRYVWRKFVGQEYKPIDKDRGELTLTVQKRYGWIQLGWITVCVHNNWRALCPDCSDILQSTKVLG